MKKTTTLNYRASRRTVLKYAGAAIALPLVARRSWASNGRLVIRDSGGPFTHAFETAFYKPFREKTGIEVVSVTSTSEPTAQIKSMVEAKSYTWDLAGGLTTAAVKQLAAHDFLEEHGLENDPNVRQIPKEYMLPHGVGTDVFTTVLGYRKDRLKKDVPESWADLWDIEKFPGRRVFRRHPIDTLEIALMASGVSPDKLYPLDLDRAFKQLDLIKPHISAWWTGGAQASQMLITGEGDLVPTWVSRVVPAADAGAPVGIMWNHNLWGVDYWAILRGGPNVELCREFIKFASDAKRQAAFTPFVVAGPTNPNAYQYIKEERAKILPTYPANKEKSIMSDSDYWSTHKSAVIERFNAWILG